MKLFLLTLFLICFVINGSAQEIESIQAEDLASLISKSTEQKAVLINVWATWCGPCIEEFPAIVELASKYKNQLDVVFISGDFEQDLDRVKEFLSNQKVDWKTYIKAGSESEFIEALHPKWSGALPFTLILKKGGKEIAYWENKAEMSKFEAFIKRAIQPN